MIGPSVIWMICIIFEIHTFIYQDLLLDGAENELMENMKFK